MLKKILINNKFRSFVLLTFAISLIVALGSYNQSDPSFNLDTLNAPQNWLGIAGSYISDMLYQFIGIASFFIPLVFITWAYFVYKNGFIKWKFIKILSCITSILLAATVLNELKLTSLPADGGGVIGIYFFKIITSAFGEIENIILPITAALSLFFLIVALGIRISIYINFTLMICNVIGKIFAFISSLSANKTDVNENIVQDDLKLKKDTWFTKFKLFVSSWSSKKINVQESINKSEPLISKQQDQPNQNESYIPKTSFTQKQSLKNSDASPVKLKEEAFSQLPSMDLLDEAKDQNIKMQTPQQLEQKAQELIAVLADFGVKGKIIDIRQGPVVTMYEFEPAAGTKSSRVIGLSDDIARSLSAISTRIAVIPGRNALGIELPNKHRMFFRLRELIETEVFADPNIILPIILGKDLGGRPLVADLAKMPHLLVAGTTGSGKSVAINTMIMSLLYRYTPSECKMIMIDPKMLELSAYDNIPHLMTPVVTEPGKAVVALKWAVKEMENRYRLMSHLGVRNIANFNAKILEAVNEGKILERKMQTGFDPETGKPIIESVPIDMQKMPFIVVIVDEMADLMLVAGKDIEGSIQRLAQMARAAGIHIIMATQRPSVDVITGVIKANFPSRISFKVTSKIDSRTILGEQGSEQLLGMGDMLYMGNSARILRVHGPFVDDKEVERVTNFLRSTGAPEYISAVTETEEDFSVDNADVDGNSDIYTQAVNIVRTERKASISYIQRCLRIGYNKAANIVEEMEKNGILSEPNHSGKREILLPED